MKEPVRTCRSGRQCRAALSARAEPHWRCSCPDPWWARLRKEKGGQSGSDLSSLLDAPLWPRPCVPRNSALPSLQSVCPLRSSASQSATRTQEEHARVGDQRDADVGALGLRSGMRRGREPRWDEPTRAAPKAGPQARPGARTCPPEMPRLSVEPMRTLAQRVSASDVSSDSTWGEGSHVRLCCELPAPLSCLMLVPHCPVILHVSSAAARWGRADELVSGPGLARPHQEGWQAGPASPYLPSCTLS